MTDRTIDAKAKRILELDERIKELQEQSDKLKEALQAEMGESEQLMTKKYVINWIHICQQKFDTKRFKTKHPDLYNIFAKDSNSRRFSVKEV